MMEVLCPEYDAWLDSLWNEDSMTTSLRNTDAIPTLAYNKVLITNARFHEAYFVWRVKLWLYFARIVERYLSTVDSVAYECKYTLNEIVAIETLTGFGYVMWNGTYSGLYCDIRELEVKLLPQAPYYKYTTWRLEAKAKRHARLALEEAGE